MGTWRSIISLGRGVISKWIMIRSILDSLYQTPKKPQPVWVKSSALKYLNYTQLLCFCPGLNWKVKSGLHDI